jgi:hypothetical protein
LLWLPSTVQKQKQYTPKCEFPAQKNQHSTHYIKTAVSKSDVDVAFGWAGGLEDEDGGQGAQNPTGAFIGAWAHGKL